MADEVYPKLRFPSSEDDLEGDLAYIEMKQYCTIAVVETRDGTLYPVSFATPDRVWGDMQRRKYYIERALIIVPETTIEVLEDATRVAWKQGFFEALKPLQKD